MRASFLALALLLLGFGCVATEAQPGPCGLISAEARGKGPGAGTDVSRSEHKRMFDAAFAKARRAALIAWQQAVRRDCPGASSEWRHATRQSIEVCDQAMGGRFTVCVKGEPARRR